DLGAAHITGTASHFGTEVVEDILAHPISGFLGWWITHVQLLSALCVGREVGVTLGQPWSGCAVQHAGPRRWRGVLLGVAHRSVLTADLTSRAPSPRRDDVHRAQRRHCGSHSN